MTEWSRMNRREFITALGAAYGSTACAFAAPRSWFIDYAGDADETAHERFVNTLCPMCPGGCGLKVRLVHGCAVGVRGNKDHPINRGGLCSRASAVLQDVYNADRLAHPLAVAGSRGSGDWNQISWDEATGRVAEKLNELRARKEPHKLCVVLGRDRGLTRTAWQRFARAFGSPNLIEAYPEANLGSHPAALAMQGVRERIGYDIAEASYVLSFSSGWLDSHWSTEQAARSFGRFRRGRAGFRPKWVHVEPRYGLTATKADEWVPIRPGGEGMLALGIAHVLIREGLYDRTFVEQHGFGFEDWTDAEGRQHLGFRRWVLREFPPSKVQAATGVPEGTIFRLAREFSADRPALALGPDGGDCDGHGAYERMAIHALNALVGSIDVPGGVTVFHPLVLLDDDGGVDKAAEDGLSKPPLDGPKSRRPLSAHALGLLVEALERREPYPVEVLILVDADPVYSLPGGDRLAEALSRIPFVVALSGYHHDSTRHADLVIPIPHMFHRWDFNTAHTLTGHPVVTIAQPLMKSPWALREPYEFLQGLTRAVGGSVAGALPWSNSKTAVEAVLDELYDKKKGAAFGPAHEESWAQLLESRGWRAPFAGSKTEFRRNVLSGGGWTDPNYFHQEWDRVFRLPRGQFAFSSAFLARSLQPAPDANDPLDRDDLLLPGRRTGSSDENDKYPLLLYVYPLPNLVGVASPNLPWLHDIAGAYMFEKWRTWVELHPETASHLGLQEGDLVEVQTARGKLSLPLKLYSGLAADVVAIPFGFGHRYGGRWCAGIGENPGRIVEPQLDPLTGAALWMPTRAAVRRA